MTRVEKHMGGDREMLAYLKTRIPVVHMSNIFLRDIQYGIHAYLRERGVRARYPEAEAAARAFVERLERQSILVPIDGQSWAVNFPDYKTPPTKPAPSAKAAAPARPAPPAKPQAAPASAAPQAERER